MPDFSTFAAPGLWLCDRVDLWKMAARSNARVLTRHQHVYAERNPPTAWERVQPRVYCVDVLDVLTEVVRGA